MRTLGCITASLALAAFLLASAAPAAAGDYHVSMNGSDTAGDGSAARPWRTITHALTRLPLATATQAHRLRIGPGLWLDGTREVFPLVIPQGVTVIGAGAGRTVIGGRAPDGRTPAPAPTVVAMQIQPSPAGWAAAIGPTGVESVSLINARIGIDVLGSKSSVPDPRIRDVIFWHDQVGIQVTQAAPTVERCVFEFGTMGIAVTRPWTGGPDLVIRECRFRYNTQGISLSNAIGILAERNRFEHNQIGAIVGTIGANKISKPLFRNNVYLQNGFGFTATALSGSRTLPILAHESFALNGTGIASVDNAPSGSRSDPLIRNCIIWASSTVDLSGVERGEIRNALVQTIAAAAGTTPPKLGQDGLVGGDPRFTDEVSGDLHLADASPAIDRGRSDYPGVPDRDVDGDPRETGFPDLGADEYRGFLRRDDAASGPGRLVLRLTARADVGLAYAAAASYGAGSGIPIGSRRLPLQPDALFFATVGLTSGLPGFLGTLNAQGRATLTVPVPVVPLPAAHVVRLAFVTLQPGAPSGIKTISNPVAVDLATP